MKIYVEVPNNEKIEVGDLNIVSSKLCTKIEGNVYSFAEVTGLILRPITAEGTSNKVKGTAARYLRKFASFIEK